MAGIFFANGIGRVTPDMFNLYNTALTIIWVIVGGRGTLIGPIFGALGLFYLTSSLGTQTVINNNLVLGIILIIFVLAVPQGIVPSVIKLWDRARSRNSLLKKEHRLRDRRSRRGLGRKTVEAAGND